MILLEVAVSAPVGQTYSYALADASSVAGSEGTDLVGRRVLVPFGRRQVTGYVVDVSDEAESEFEIKPIIRFIDELPLFHAEMVPFFKWAAGYYHYPLGQVIKTALPGGLTASPEKVICLTKTGIDSPVSAIPDRIRQLVWFRKLAELGRLSEKESRQVLAGKENEKDLKLLLSAGAVSLENSLGKDRVRAKLEVCYRLSGRLSEYLEDSHSMSDSEALLAAVPGRRLTRSECRSLSLLHQMQLENPESTIPRKEFTKRYSYGGKLVKKLITEGLVEQSHRRIFRTPFGDLLPYHAKPERLSDEQQTALQAVIQAIDNAGYQPFLLQGVTGSGKTEVYLRAAEHSLTKGRGVLVLVPEIALATQIEAHFISRFQDRVALLHSGLTQGERFDEWWRILSAEARIVIGARSAVFAPLNNLGLVIIDEEHDSSFKQEDGLRYNGRDLALVRAKLTGCTVVLGSATPSITSHYHSTTAKYRLLQMNRRIGDRDLPDSLILDLKDSSDRKGFRLFHPCLAESLAETLQKGEQSILLLNRRGFATSVICRDCGTMAECRHCKISLNLHRQKNELLCHYCGFNLSGQTRCSTCGSDNLQPVGFGTERIEEEVKTLLPQARIARLDSDVAADRKQFLTILKAMRDHRIDILVGTQIIAKGLHFPDVSLVGIVLADSGLGFPDFRAAEKTFQLITQVTGRAGRGDAPGKVIIQTMQPDHYAIAMAAENRYDDLVQKELSIRKSVGFPPYTRLVFIIVEDPDAAVARKASQEIISAAREWCRNNDPPKLLTLLGPAPAPLERLRDRFRNQILLKSKDLRTLHRLTAWISHRFKTKGQTRVVIDIDPENML